MTVELPDWTEYTTDETDHRGLDPLGLESVGAGIVRRLLLPGITNATRHVRYYSFFFWVFWTFQEDCRRRGLTKGYPSEQKRWRLRLENILRAATLHVQPGMRGLVGRRKASGWFIPLKARVQVDQAGAATAFQPAFYSASFRALGCGQWIPGKLAQLTKFGEQLARAFHSSLLSAKDGHSYLPAALSNKASISGVAVRKLSKAICLHSVKPSEQEHRHLLGMLLRYTPGFERSSSGRTDRARSRSFALFLEIVRQSKGRLTSTHGLHEIFATGAFSKGRPFTPPAQLSSDFEIWKRYQERQYIKLGLYGIWYEVLHFLTQQQMNSANLSHIISTLSESFSASRVLRDWLGPAATGRSVATVSKSLSRRLERSPNQFGKDAIKLAESVLDLYTPTADRLGICVLLLLCSPFVRLLPPLIAISITFL